MSSTALLDLEEIAREAAWEVAGADAVRGVDIAPDYAFGRPIYRFSFLIDRARARQRPGLILSRLTQRLRDALEARDDAHFPTVRLFDEAGWQRRQG